MDRKKTDVSVKGNGIKLGPALNNNLKNPLDISHRSPEFEFSDFKYEIRSVSEN
jgi:hypothetical protein